MPRSYRNAAAEKRNRKNRTTRRLRFEDLEHRQLLAGVPTATILGTSDGYQGVRAQTRVVNFKATDPDPIAQAGTFNYTINWGDGVVQVASGPSTLGVSHVYNYNGNYPVTVQVRNQSGVTSAYSAATNLNIGIVEQQGASVALGGTYGYDLFTLDQQPAARTFGLSVNYVNYGNFTIGNGGQVLMFGNANYDQAYLNGGANNDAFAVTPTGMLFNSVPIVADGVEVENIAGLAGNDTLTGADIANSWQLSSQNSGVLNTGYNFATMENLVGGSAADVFKLTSVNQLTGTLDGGGGINTLDDSQFSGALVIDFAAGTATGTGGMANIQSVLGNSVSVTIAGPNTNNVWNLNGTRAGNINGITAFSGVTKLIGGNQNDQFKFTDSALGLSLIDGGAGADTLDHSAMVGAARVNIKNAAAMNTSLIGQFLNVENVIGSNTALGTFYGPDVDANWNITGPNQGNVGGVAFSKFNITAGGQGTDRFAFFAGGSLTGSLDGGAGVNLLDYSGYNAGVNVNLTARTATGTAGILNFRMALGSPFNDTFLGDTMNDVFFGNAGDDNITGGSTRDFLVGGSGSDVIHGAYSYDMLYGGSTIYFNEATRVLDLASINLILATWMTSLEYYTRVAQLSTGLNPLMSDSTLINDNAIDQLYGDELRDWFVRDPNDVVNDFDPTNESITNVHLGPANNPPTLSTINTFNGVEDTALNIPFSTLVSASNAFDADGNALSFIIDSLGSGTLTKNNLAVTAGTQISSGDTLVWTPSSNSNGLLTAFNVKAYDGIAASSTAVAVKVNVAAVNDAPTLNTVATLNGATQDTPFSIPFTTLAAAADEADVDSNPISFRIEAIASGSLTKNGAAAPVGTIVSAGDTLIWTPPVGTTGLISAFSVKAWDGQEASSTAIPVAVNVAAVNHAPTLSTISTLTGANSNTPFTITYAALAAAGNSADSDGNAISFRVESLSSGTLTKNGVAVVAGTTLLSAGESLVWTPANGASGTLEAFKVKAWDGQLASSTAVAVNVSVVYVNHAPTLTTISNIAGPTGINPFTLTFATLAAAADEADSDNDLLSFRIEAVTSGTLTKNGSAVVPGTTLFSAGDSLVWTPAANANGLTNAFTVKAWDGLLASATAVQVKINVTIVNAGPLTATILGTTDGYQGVRAQTRVVNFKATDPDPIAQAGTFNYTINWGDGVVQVASGPSTLGVSHVYNYNGNYPVTVQVRNQSGVTSAYSAATNMNIGIVEQQGASVALGGTYGYDLFTVDQQPVARTFGLSVNYVNYGNFTIGNGGQVLMFGNANYDQAYLNGGANNDTFAVTPTGMLFNSVPIVADGVEVENIAGLAGNDTLTGADIANSWQLSSQNSGVLNTGYNFATIENLVGGSAADVFKLTSVNQLTGTIDGGGGINTLDDSQFSGALVIDFAAGTATGTGGMANIQSVLGNSVSVTIAGPNTNNVWNLNGTRAGNINGITAFSGVTKLIGGNQNDQFKFTDSALGLSLIDGGAGADTLDHSAMVGAARVNIKSAAAMNTSLIGQFLNVENVIGSNTALGTFYGPDVDANWNITGPNQGNVGGVAFSKFNITAGGQGTDRFAFFAGGSLTGSLDGGAGVNLLDYSGYNAGVNVNLTARTATGTAGILNFRMALGSPFNDTFLGDTMNDVFFGNAGDDNITGGSTRDFLVGGSGSDVIHGAYSYDMLYGGSTIYFNEATRVLDLTSINLILATWMTSLEYYTRVAQLSTGSNPLMSDSTLINDNAIDQLYGDELRDWFLRDPNDVVNDFDPTNESITNVHV